jgi:hypothetical protein
MEVSKDGCVLHLSEQRGDCSPGAGVRIETNDLDGFHTELAAKGYENALPGIDKALGQELTDKTLFTGFGQMVGTPLYM